MKIRLLTFQLMLLSTAVGAADYRLVYQLQADRRDVDIDYAYLDDLHKAEKHAWEDIQRSKKFPSDWSKVIGNKQIEKFFGRVVVGKHRVLAFCGAEFVEAESSHGGEEFIGHHLLVLKVDSKDRIVDGFYFFREWGEQPMLHMILRYQVKNRILKHLMAIRVADFQQTGRGGSTPFRPDGRIDMFPFRDRILNLVESPHHAMEPVRLRSEQASRDFVCRTANRCTRHF